MAVRITASRLGSTGIPTPFRSDREPRRHSGGGVRIRSPGDFAPRNFQDFRDPGINISTKGIEDAFGAGIARQVTNFGAALEGIALEQNKERQDIEDITFDAAATSAAQSEFTRMALDFEKQDPDATGESTLQFNADLGAGVNTILDDLQKTRGLRPSKRALAVTRGKLERFRGRFAARAMVVNDQKRVAQLLSQLDGSIEDSALAAFNSPADRGEFLAGAEEAIDQAVEQGLLSPEEAKEARENGRRTVTEGAVRGRIAKTPDLALAELEAGVYDDGLTAEKKAGFIKAAEVAIRLDKARVEADREKITDAAQNDLLKKLHDETLTFEDVFAAPLDPFGSGSKETFLKALERQSKEPTPKSDSIVYNEFLKDAYNGDIKDPNSVLDRIGDGLTSQDAEHIRGVAVKALKPDLDRRQELLKRAVKTGQRAIIKGNQLIGFDADSVIDAFKFEHDLRATIEAGEAAGKTAENMLTPQHTDYVVEQVIDRYRLTPGELINRAADRLKRTRRGTTTVEPRKPGESVSEYLKRTGK